MSESKRGPGRPPKRVSEEPVEEVQAVEAEEVPSIVKAVAAIFTDEPVKQVRNLTRESVAAVRGELVASKMIQ